VRHQTKGPTTLTHVCSHNWIPLNQFKQTHCTYFTKDQTKLRKKKNKNNQFYAYNRKCYTR